jgi:tetratricopeptide (TPR) repeat protein
MTVVWTGLRRWWLLFVLLLILSGGGALAVIRLAARPVDPHRLRAQATAAVKAERFAEAEAALAQLPTKRPLDWILQSKVDLAGGRPDAALADLAHVPDTDRLGALARYSEGYLLFHSLHRAPAAERALRRAIQLDPRSVPARRELSYLYYILSMQREYAEQFRVLEALGQVTFDDVYHACILLRRGDETRQIVQELNEFLRVDPSDRRTRLALAVELRRLDRGAEAQHVLAALPASDTRAQSLRAELALDRGDLETARQIVTAGPAHDPDLAPLRGRLALAGRDAQTALHEYRTALAAYPGRREVLSGLGRALRLAGDPHAAAPYLKAAAEYDQLELLMQNLVAPRAAADARLLFKLGAACEALQRYPEARAWFRLSYSAHPALETQAALARLAGRDAGSAAMPGEPVLPNPDSAPAP